MACLCSVNRSLSVRLVSPMYCFLHRLHSKKQYIGETKRTQFSSNYARYLFHSSIWHENMLGHLSAAGHYLSSEKPTVFRERKLL